MADNGDSDSGENPIPELANLNINHYTLAQLHDLRNAINNRIEELTAPPPVSADLVDILQRCNYSLHDVVAAVRKSTGVEAQLVEAVYAVALHRIGWNGATRLRRDASFDVGKGFFWNRNPEDYINTIFRPDPDRGVDLLMATKNLDGHYCIHLIQIKHGKTKVSVGSNNNFNLRDYIRPKLYAGRDEVLSWFPASVQHSFHLFNVGGYDAKSTRSMNGENNAFLISFMETARIKEILLNVMAPYMADDLGHLA